MMCTSWQMSIHTLKTHVSCMYFSLLSEGSSVIASLLYLLHWAFVAAILATMEGSKGREGPRISPNNAVHLFFWAALVDSPVWQSVLGAKASASLALPLFTTA